MSEHCKICGEPFDDGLHKDCGGDCLTCMAVVGEDPDCQRALVDMYVAQRAHIAELMMAAREVARLFPLGRTEGTYKDVRVYNAQAGVKQYRSRGGRKVMIVDKLKSKEKS